MVIYEDGKSVWQTNTSGSGAGTVTLDHSGKLCLRGADGTVRFQNELSVEDGPRVMIMQDDGNLVIYRDDRADWDEAIWDRRDLVKLD